MSTISVRYGTPAKSKKKAGGDTPGPAPTPTETLLWTNPNTSTARSSLTCSLSDSLENYKSIRIEYAYNTSSSAAPYYVTYPIFREDGTTYMFPSGNTQPRMCIGLNSASGNAFVRQSYVSNDTTIHFNNAYRVNASGNTNTNLIPWYIYGIK